jgi:TRAP-type C4-dicarboxylate transport system permease large subunit
MIIATTVFSYLIGSSGMLQSLSNFISSSGLSPWLVMICINILLLILGCIMDGLAILLVCVPLFVPVIVALGFDPVWFGVIMCVNLEIGLITPPVAINLFLMKAVFNVPIFTVIRGVFPYLIVLLIFLAVIMAFPALSLWLPSMMRGG